MNYLRGEKLGVSVRGYLGRRRSEFNKNAAVVDEWREMLPQHLREACSLESISGGTILVAAEPGPYAHELRVISDELIRSFQQRCPRAGVKKIKIVPRNTRVNETEQAQ